VYASCVYVDLSDLVPHWDPFSDSEYVSEA
jgi:hypothetical protein